MAKTTAAQYLAVGWVLALIAAWLVICIPLFLIMAAALGVI